MADGLTSNEVYSLYEDKQGNFWVGTGKGLCLYTPNKGRGSLFSAVDIPLPKDLPPNTNPSFQGSHWVYDIVQASDGKLWFASIDGVFVYDAKNLPVPQGEFSFFSISDDSIGFLTQNDKIERMMEDKEGTMWFGGDGFFRFNPNQAQGQGKSFTRFTPKSGYLPGVWVISEDKNGNIWVGTRETSLFLFDGETLIPYSEHSQ